MKSIVDINSELKDNNWISDSNIEKEQNLLLPILSKALDEQEQVISQIWGLRVIDKTTSEDIQVVTLTDKRIVTVYKNLATRSEKVKVNSQPIDNVKRTKISESKKDDSIAYKISFLNNEICTKTEEIDAVKHFDTHLKHLQEVDKPRFDFKTFVLNVYKNNESIFTNSNIWYSVSALMTLALIIIAAVLLGANTTKSVWIPAGVFGAIFSLICGISNLILIAINWDKYKFSNRLYVSSLSFFMNIFIFIISIIVASQTNLFAMYIFEAIILVWLIFSMFDSIYNFSKDSYLITNGEN